MCFRICLASSLEIHQTRVVEGILLGQPVGDEEVVVAIPVPVASCQAHGPTVVGNPGSQADVLEGLAPIEVQGVVGDVVRHVEIEAAVVIEVLPQGSQAATAWIRHAPELRHLGEGAVAVVLEE